MEKQKSNKGRKPVADRKVPLRVYVQESQIENMGGFIAAHQLVIKYIERYKPRK